MNEQLYRAFVDEVQALESFRLAYAAEHPATPLQPDDPDVRRLLEALALFAARSRQAALRTLVDQRRRLFRQFLPYLLEPLPAMGMVQAIPTGRLTEAVELPCGTELAVRAAGEETAIFRTLAPLRLLPLSLGRLGTHLLPDGRLRFTLPVTASYPRTDELGRLRIHVNYLNDFNASLKVLDAIARHAERVTLSFDERVDEETRGLPCQMSVGTATGDADDPKDDGGLHPLARERLYFHFPRSEAFFDVTLPSPPRHWQRFTIVLDVARQWPRNLRLSAEVFQLFATPIVNLSRAMAQPIVHDGTGERWPIRHPAAAGRHQLHSVRGVYRLAGEGLVPLRPATLAGGGGAYELADGAGARGPALLSHLPEALAQPTTLSVDAEWHQPWFSSLIGQRLTVEPYRRALAGVQWELTGELVPHREAAIADSVDDLTRILVLQHKSRLARDELEALLACLGSVWSGPFAAVRTLITDVSVREAPASRGGRASGARLIYELEVAQHEAGLQPLVHRFARHLERVLAAWIADSLVEVRVRERP